jgi:hypothetical protein
MTTRATNKETKAEADYPAAWIWDDDGDELEGTFERAGKGYTANGEKPFVTLRVGEDLRTLWLLHDVLRNTFAREVHRRPDHEIKVGETVHAWRRERRESANGRSYVDYRVEFPDGPTPSQMDVFGLPDEVSEEEASSAVKADVPEQAEEADDGVPF